MSYLRIIDNSWDAVPTFLTLSLSLFQETHHGQEFVPFVSSHGKTPDHTLQTNKAVEKPKIKRKDVSSSSAIPK